MENILLIVPKYYEYETAICNALSKKGNKITLIYENIETVRLYYKTVQRYCPVFRDKVFFNYYHNRLKNTTQKFDRVIVIRGGNITNQIMELIKQHCSDHCKYIMYQWDSVKNNSIILDYIHHFHKVYTFDILDAKKYGWEYRPLFFINDFIKEEEKEVDISFICALHSKRAELYNKLKQYEKKGNLRVFVNVYSQFIFYLKHKYINKLEEYQAISDKDVSFRALSVKESYNIYNKTKVLLDYTHPGQSGYTMRTIESLGARCKLITNNARIVEADFFNPNNILVYKDDLSDFDIPADFLNAPYEDIPESVYRSYSLDGWAETFLS